MIHLLTLAAPALAQAPSIPECTVLRPAFQVGDQTFSAGTMFPARMGDKVLMFTAHHLLGPAGGLPAQLTGPQVPTEVTSVTVRDAFTGTSCGSARSALAIADAAPMSETTVRDLAVFVPEMAAGLDRLSSTRKAELSPLALAEANPAKGDKVWVAASFAGAEGRTFPAEIVEVSDGAVYYQYEDAGLDLTATSGAAVVDAEGKVVAINLGGGKMPDGNLVGAGNPVAAVRGRVEGALAAE